MTKIANFLVICKRLFGPDGFKTSEKMPKRTKFVFIWYKKKSPRPWGKDIGSGGKKLRVADYSASVPSPPGGLVPPVESPPEGVLPPVEGVLPPPEGLLSPVKVLPTVALTLRTLAWL